MRFRVRVRSDAAPGLPVGASIGALTFGYPDEQSFFVEKLAEGIDARRLHGAAGRALDRAPVCRRIRWSVASCLSVCRKSPTLDRGPNCSSLSTEARKSARSAQSF